MTPVKAGIRAEALAAEMRQNPALLKTCRAAIQMVDEDPLGPRTDVPRAVQEKLGKVSDEDLAREAGVGRTTISRWRTLLGVAPWKPHRFSPPRPLPEEAQPWFGAVPDREIARRLLVPVQQIARWRLKHPELPAPPRTTSSKLDAYRRYFGVETDRQIARLAGVGRLCVANYRLRHPGLPPSPWMSSPPPLIREHHGARTKLDQPRVAAIKRRLAQGIPQRALAREYGVAKSTISSVATGVAWAWVQAAEED